jgi:hypothetical protein
MIKRSEVRILEIVGDIAHIFNVCKLFAIFLLNLFLSLS